MLKKDFYYNLPSELIAQTPLADRSASRLMILDKTTGETTCRHFCDIKELLNVGDCLVLNDTRVIPARLHGKKAETGADVEFLLIKRNSADVWQVLTRPAKRLKEGTKVIFSEKLSAEILSEEEGGQRIVKFMFDGVFEEVLSELGEMPLPPYIKEKLKDSERYQTVYSREEGSAAAPTAGLHFTNELLKEIETKGITIAKVTLHVGLGTFLPVKETVAEHHKMHSEYFYITEQNAKKINEVKKSGGRIVAVGTTSARALESSAENGYVIPAKKETNIFIYPPYKFQIVDALITNFHLPESTLIMLVSALAGRESILAAYEKAVNEKFRFFSFGDAMFIH
ncbi:MAG: tRNA preQ1(34) S-adenosylmethionine ribosyltransferase-isomerase QueA [Clostridiales bacterium]|jgi:S-adenosylmethionine:tRNA ribosyltransferase-isomerase|nr:tRNA preQ1(34) S-adenosylmethionine ribosyltransferase-isomerase QueA [Clostridiales bacterium]